MAIFEPKTWNRRSVLSVLLENHDTCTEDIIYIVTVLDSSRWQLTATQLRSLVLLGFTFPPHIVLLQDSSSFGPSKARAVVSSVNSIIRGIISIIGFKSSRRRREFLHLLIKDGD